MLAKISTNYARKVLQCTFVNKDYIWHKVIKQLFWGIICGRLKEKPWEGYLSYSTLSALSWNELLAGSADVEIHLGKGEVGTVEWIEVVHIGFSRIALRKEEGLCHLALVVDTCHVGTRDGAVLTFGWIDKPMAVAAPVVIALRLVGVYLGDGASLACAQVH